MYANTLWSGRVGIGSLTLNAEKLAPKKGLDMQPGREGGTWFGVSTMGRIACLLSILTPGKWNISKKGRGFLVSNYLNDTCNTWQYVRDISTDRHDYNGFNLVLLERRDGRWVVVYYTNRDDNSPHELKQGVIALSNSTYSKPWQKVKHGRVIFFSIVNQYNSVSKRDELKARLFEFLCSTERHLPDPQLEEQGRTLSDDVLSERSAIFVESPEINGGTIGHLPCDRLACQRVEFEMI
ncbi:Transport and Golgi organization-like protein 2 [Lamellibrachia satsuma]|nr:Transport and Golgi organization-like protein 2 [Lamellibrachia satsuma]